jgi:hypothetical protein
VSKKGKFVLKREDTVYQTTRKKEDLSARKKKTGKRTQKVCAWVGMVF